MYVQSSDSQTSASRRSVVLTIPDGDRGVETTVRYISRFVERAVHSADVNALAVSILHEANVPQHNPKADAKAIYKWVLRNIRYVPEVDETLRPVEEILRVRAGDCDDINGILLPSLLLSVGIPARLVTVAVEPDAPNAFSHIYAEALIDGEWIALDAARPGARFGREPEHYFRKRIWHIGSNRYSDVAGMRRLNGYRSLGAIDWTQLLQAGTYGTAQILSASKTGIPPIPTAASPYVTSGLVPGTTTLAPNSALGLGTGSSGIVLLALGVGALFLLKGRK
jgi:transglutaminase-like putative cysteine protease